MRVPGASLARGWKHYRKHAAGLRASLARVPRGVPEAADVARAELRVAVALGNLDKAPPNELHFLPVGAELLAIVRRLDASAPNDAAAAVTVEKI